MKVIIALDIGTTKNKAIAFSQSGKIVAESSYECLPTFPKPGWVEIDPIKMWKTTNKALREVVKKVGAKNVVNICITNQRETTILWDSTTKKPINNAISWQCNRTQKICEKLKRHNSKVKRKTGLPLEAYFSATKIKWILQKIKTKNKRILFGTVDTWILWNLTGVHATEPSNASRTLLVSLKTGEYDESLLKIFKIDKKILPKIIPSDSHFGNTLIEGHTIPVIGILGDQQASLFAHSLGTKVTKATFGTGLFVMSLKPTKNKSLLKTIAWSRKNKITYASEGSAYMGASSIQWIRDNMGLIKNVKDTEKIAKSIKGSEGVVFIPALQGLGAPYWDKTARGLFIGMTRKTTKAHMIRSVLESLGFQTKDLVKSFRSKSLHVDGGASQNDFIMQFTADICNTHVKRTKMIQSTAFGVAALSGLATGFFSKEKCEKMNKVVKTFAPKMNKKDRNRLYSMWSLAIERSQHWTKLD